VAQELPKVLTPEQLEVGGLTIRSSLNLAWQDHAQKIIDANTPGALQGALISMEPGTGLVRALVGGKDYNKSQFNRAVQALRSPGSTFKLFVYLTALKQGMKPEDIVVDEPRCFAGYCPKTSATATWAASRCGWRCRTPSTWWRWSCCKRWALIP
jgi:penicillin-binding protein 1A